MPACVKASRPVLRIKIERKLEEIVNATLAELAEIDSLTTDVRIKTRIDHLREFLRQAISK
jgi:hypothetical protein